MTIMAFAEHIERCISDRADSLRSEKTSNRVTYTAEVGKQAFVVTVEEVARDDQQPAIT